MAGFECAWHGVLIHAFLGAIQILVEFGKLLNDRADNQISAADPG